jgi:hypothetical protein
VTPAVLILRVFLDNAAVVTSVDLGFITMMEYDLGEYMHRARIEFSSRRERDKGAIFATHWRRRRSGVVAARADRGLFEHHSVNVNDDAGRKFGNSLGAAATNTLSLKGKALKLLSFVCVLCLFDLSNDV